MPPDNTASLTTAPSPRVSPARRAFAVWVFGPFPTGLGLLAPMLLPAGTFRSLERGLLGCGWMMSQYAGVMLTVLLLVRLDIWRSVEVWSIWLYWLLIGVGLVAIFQEWTPPVSQEVILGLTFALVATCPLAIAGRCIAAAISRRNRLSNEAVR